MTGSQLVTLKPSISAITSATGSTKGGFTVTIAGTALKLINNPIWTSVSLLHLKRGFLNTYISRELSHPAESAYTSD